MCASSLLIAATFAITLALAIPLPARFPAIPTPATDHSNSVTKPQHAFPMPAPIPGMPAPQTGGNSGMQFPTAFPANQFPGAGSQFPAANPSAALTGPAFPPAQAKTNPRFWEAGK